VVSKIAFLYLGLMAWGCLALLPLVSLKEIGQGFYRFFGYLCVALDLLAVGIALLDPLDFGGKYLSAVRALGASLFFTLCFSVALRIRVRWFLWSCYGAAVFCGGAALGWFPWNTSAGSWLLSAHALSSGLLLGSGILAMMLGHWYLVTPKLSITPLKRYAAGYILLTVWTALELGLSYLLFVGTGPQPSTAAGGSLVHEYLIFALFRLAWGILPPLGLAYWIWTTVSMKSTQSATGILYAAMVCTIVGEGMGLFLTLGTGIPF
jgi:hypothetical protein